MSVVINSNFAATIAANNLAASNAMLQRSLNRLSSGSKIVTPADDAGGLAVSMKLAAEVARQSAVAANLGNATSYLQTQDGALGVAAKVLSRMSELKTLDGDVTKSASDRANYNAEFTQLQAQLSSLGNETFNGQALFGTAASSLPVTADPSSTTVAVGGANLLGAPAFAAFSDNFSNLNNWTDQSIPSGSVSVSGNKLDLFGAPSGYAKVTSQQSFSGAFDITLNLQLPTGSNDELQVKLGSDTLADLHYGTDINDHATHSVRISFDGAGTATTYLDGASTPAQTQTGISATSGALSLGDIVGINHALVSNLSVTSTAGANNVSNAADASNLSSVSLLTLTSAIQDVATLRANNGAQQSRLGFAAELLSVNQANLEAANSRITDVDVAQESTSLARYNILVQAGTAMLSQANQSSQIALKLLG